MRARKYRFHLSDECPDWEPLFLFADLSLAFPHLRPVIPCDFMWMGSAHHVRSSHRLDLYKNVDSRRYLNLDAGGHAFFVHRHEVNDHGGWTWYRPHREPQHAILHLGLHTIPFDVDAPRCDRCRARAVGYDEASVLHGSRATLIDYGEPHRDR